MDRYVSMEAHRRKAAYFNLYNIGKIRKPGYLNQDSTACITFKLDYCDSLLCVLPAINRLQRIQNIACG